MEIRYTATPADVGALFRYNLRRSRRLKLTLAGVAAFPATMSALTAHQARGRVTAADVVPGVVFGLLAAATLPLWVRLRTKRDERILTVGPAGIQTTIGRLAGEVPWARVDVVAETPEHLFITGKSLNGFAVPARAFATPAARAEFIRLVRAYQATAINSAAG